MSFFCPSPAECANGIAFMNILVTPCGAMRYVLNEYNTHRLSLKQHMQQGYCLIIIDIDQSNGT